MFYTSTAPGTCRTSELRVTRKRPLHLKPSSSTAHRRMWRQNDGEAGGLANSPTSTHSELLLTKYCRELCYSRGRTLPSSICMLPHRVSSAYHRSLRAS